MAAFQSDTQTDTVQPDIGVDDGSESAEATVVTSTPADVSAPVLRVNDLYTIVAERSGAKRRDVKPVVDAALAVMGEALADGRAMNLGPLGKVRINRTEEKAQARVVICKVRQSDTAISDEEEPLAETEEAG